MTSRQLFEYALIELNKVQAPSLLLEDYNYFINKAVSQYINKVYNLYDINQQKSDDLRVLKSTAVLVPINTANSYNKGEIDSLFGKISEVHLPDDYLHTLNCVVEYQVKKTFKCYDEGTKIHFGAKRLTADMFSQIINNYYMRPQYRSPYYYINNVTIKPTFITEDNQTPVQESPDATRTAEVRYGNNSRVKMEIRYGKDTNTFELSKVYIDYLKAPHHIRLTQVQVDEVEDKSQVLEFPDYVCQEVVNELIRLLMENASDPRLQTNIPINQSIANPAQEQPKK